jgi:hypothetical protein
MNKLQVSLCRDPLGALSAAATVSLLDRVARSSPSGAQAQYLHQLKVDFLKNTVVRELSHADALRECLSAGVQPFWPVQEEESIRTVMRNKDRQEPPLLVA